MLSSLIRVSGVVAALSPLALGQMAVAPHTIEAYVLDSGYLHNETDAEAVLFRGLVRFDDAGWLQLHFEDTNLPAGSRLRLTSLQDGAVQWFNAHSLRDYSNQSASFNGGAVRVELIAAPRTRANRVNVHEVVAGDSMPQALEPDTICGTTDDRVPSSDPRGGRQWPTTCTAWLGSPTIALTAGHCASPTQQIHFNNPLSTGGGSVVLPPPDDQYAFDGASLRQLNAGQGADWAVVSVVRNSNTDLYPGQKQGDWYRIGIPPDNLQDATIRITGTGSTGSGVPREWNYAQKTHTGPLYSVSNTSLRYRTDTTGGNSGSPVIWEEMNQVIGIHTHGGCGTSTNSANTGTKIDRQDLQAAIATANSLRTAGLYTTFGTGCSGTNGTPKLSSSTFPDLGKNMTLDVSGVLPNQPGTMFFGASSTNWGAVPLPLTLNFGCTISVSLDVAVPLATGSNARPTLTFQIPDDVALIGAEFYNQYLSFDGAANGGGATFTNGARAIIGD